MAYAKPLLRLLELLEKLPGIGPRSAERIAFHLLKVSPEHAQQLAQALQEARQRLRFCEICFNLSDAARCAICDDPTRDASVICVVEEPKDVLAIEKTGSFRGLYHVLLGSIAPLDGVGPELLKIDELLARLDGDVVQEVILAMDADKDGETTTAYLSKLLHAHDGIRVSRLASGIPVGSHLEYADQATLARALEGRRLL